MEKRTVKVDTCVFLSTLRRFKCVTSFKMCCILLEENFHDKHEDNDTKKGVASSEKIIAALFQTKHIMLAREPKTEQQSVFQ